MPKSKKSEKKILKPNFSLENELKGETLKKGDGDVDGYVVWEWCYVCDINTNTEENNIHIHTEEHFIKLKIYLEDKGFSFIPRYLKQFGIDMFTEVVNEILQEEANPKSNIRIEKHAGYIMNELKMRTGTVTKFCKNCDCTNCTRIKSYDSGNGRERDYPISKQESRYGRYLR